MFMAFIGLPVFAQRIPLPPFTFPTVPSSATKRVAMPPVVMPNTASNGFGGTHVSYTDNIYSLLVNPAAMMRVEQWNPFTLAPSLFSPQTFFDFASSLGDLVKGNTGAFGEMLDGIGKRKGKVGLGFDLREFPLSVAWVADGFGLGFWNRVFVNVNLIDANIDANVYGDMMFPFGFAFKILNLENHSIDAGITIKPFLRFWIKESKTLMSLVSADSILGDINIPAMAGGAFNLGLLYRWNRGLQFGLTFNDILSGTMVLNDTPGNEKTSYYVPFALNMGLSYSFSLAFVGFTLAADWRDVVNAFHRNDYTRRNSQLDFGVGLEASLFDIFFVCIGMNEMLPACGLGFDLAPFKIDLAYYGKEFGLEPGQLSTAIFEVSVSIRPDAKERNWPWTRRSLIGLLTDGD